MMATRIQTMAVISFARRKWGTSARCLTCKRDPCVHRYVEMDLSRFLKTAMMEAFLMVMVVLRSVHSRLDGPAAVSLLAVLFAETSLDMKKNIAMMGIFVREMVAMQVVAWSVSGNANPTFSIM